MLDIKYVVFRDAQQNAWAKHHHNFYKVQKGFLRKQWRRKLPKEYLSYFIDRQERLWCFDAQGVDLYSPRGSKLIASQRARFSVIERVQEDAEGNIFLRTERTGCFLLKAR